LALAFSKPETLISMALLLQNRITLSLLAIAGMLLLIGLVFLVLLNRNFKTIANPAALKRRRLHHQALSSTIWASVAFALASAASLDQTTGDLQYATKGVPLSPVYITPGTTLRVLQWVILAFSTTFAMCIPMLFKAVDSPTQSASAIPSFSAPPSLSRNGKPTLVYSSWNQIPN
jgi:hypothetical protein